MDNQPVRVGMACPKCMQEAVALVAEQAKVVWCVDGHVSVSQHGEVFHQVYEFGA